MDPETEKTLQPNSTLAGTLKGTLQGTLKGTLKEHRNPERNPERIPERNPKRNPERNPERQRLPADTDFVPTTGEAIKAGAWTGLGDFGVLGCLGVWGFGV